LQVELMNSSLAHLSYSLDGGVSWRLMGPAIGPAPLLWLSDTPRLQLRPIRGFRGTLDLRLGALLTLLYLLEVLCTGENLPKRLKF
jgi:hypothetical protein